ncbi:MAG: hypothetical protein FJ318_06615 [SAR202 cluster bacterium]|nr:hypothetical protein [SAR202 cluster bacterium]
MLHHPGDLRRAFTEIGPSLWIRATRGAGGKGSLPVDDFKTALRWIDLHNGWGEFMAARRLAETTVTLETVWRDGRLIAAQGRQRLFWEFAHLAPSGVTGIGGGHK